MTTKPARPTRDDDHALTLRVLRTILNAQAKGTLSPEMYVRRLPMQIVLENTTEADREWLTSKYKGATESRGWMFRQRANGNKVSKTLEEAVFTAPLRKKVDDQDRHIPRLEIWGVSVLHKHHSLTGSIANGTTVWRCGVCKARVKREGI